MWNADQKTLEEQALKELDIFSQDNQRNDILEESKTKETTNENNDKLPIVSLNLEKYIQTQEALKKRQIFQKIQSCNSNEEKTQKIYTNLSHLTKRKRKNKNDCLTSNISSVTQETIEIKETIYSRNNNYNSCNDSESDYIPSENELGMDFTDFHTFPVHAFINIHLEGLYFVKFNLFNYYLFS